MDYDICTNPDDYLPDGPDLLNAQDEAEAVGSQSPPDCESPSDHEINVCDDEDDEEDEMENHRIRRMFNDSKVRSDHSIFGLAPPTLPSGPISCGG